MKEHYSPAGGQGLEVLRVKEQLTIRRRGLVPRPALLSPAGLGINFRRRRAVNWWAEQELHL